MTARKRIDAFATLAAVQAYMDDAAMFPEHFKPGVVRGHQRDYARLREALDELLAADRALDLYGMSDAAAVVRRNRALEAFL